MVHYFLGFYGPEFHRFHQLYRFYRLSYRLVSSSTTKGHILIAGSIDLIPTRFGSFHLLYNCLTVPPSVTRVFILISGSMGQIAMEFGSINSVFDCLIDFSFTVHRVHSYLGFYESDYYRVWFIQLIFFIVSIICCRSQQGLKPQIRSERGLLKQTRHCQRLLGPGNQVHLKH